MVISGHFNLMLFCCLLTYRSYFVVSPRKIRPNQVMQMSVSLLRLYYDNINFRAVIRRGQEEICSTSYLFTTTGTQLLQMWVSDFVQTMKHRASSSSSSSPQTMQDCC